MMRAGDIASLPFTSESVGFQLIALAAMFAWCLIMYRFRRQVARVFKSVLTLKHQEAVSGDDNKLMYDRFQASALALGVVTIGLAVVKAAAGFGVAPNFGSASGLVGAEGLGGATNPASALGFGGASWLPPVAVAVVGLVAVVIVALQFGVLKLAGRLTFSSPLTDAVIRAKKAFMSAMTMVVTPLVLMFSAVNPLRDGTLALLVATIVVTMSLALVGHVFILFVRQKVSGLVWFLYLCTVEVFPVCAVMLLAAKNV